MRRNQLPTFTREKRQIYTWGSGFWCSLEWGDAHLVGCDRRRETPGGAPAPGSTEERAESRARNAPKNWAWRFLRLILFFSSQSIS